MTKQFGGFIGTEPYQIRENIEAMGKVYNDPKLSLKVDNLERVTPGCKTWGCDGTKSQINLYLGKRGIDKYTLSQGKKF